MQPVDPQRLNSGGSLFLTRPTLVHYIVDVQELRWRASEVFDWIVKGELEVRIGGAYRWPMPAARKRTWLHRRTTGKLLLLPARSRGDHACPGHAPQFVRPEKNFSFL